MQHIDEFHRVEGPVIRLRQDTAERLLGHCFADYDRPALAQAVAAHVRRPIDPTRIEIIERGSFGVIGPMIGWKIFRPSIGVKRSMPVETYRVIGSGLGIDCVLQLTMQGVKGCPDTLEWEEPYRLAIGEQIVGPWDAKRRRYHLLTGETPAMLAERLSGEMVVLSTARNVARFSI